jgi:hypothetical protein
LKGVTFALFSEQSGGAALWLETQNVAVDASGTYNALLGAATQGGIPQDIFSSGEARWLEVSYTAADGSVVSQPRVLLVSVPYALKSGDATTLGGLPASAFMLNPEAMASRVKDAGGLPGAAAAPTGAGTTGRLVKWLDGANSVLADSTISEVGGSLGVGTAAPVHKVHVAAPGELILALDSTGANARKWGLAVNPGFDPGSFHFYDFTADVSRFKISGATGNMAVGSGAPALSRFEVNGGMAVGGAYAGVNAAPQYGLIVEGSMGLGTPTPAHKFHIRNAGEVVLALDSTGTGARKWGIVVNPAFNPSGLNFYDFTADQSRFAFSAAGDMGVGVANPTAKLDVAGTVKSTGFTMNVGASLNGKVLTSDANGVASWQTPAGGVAARR